MVAGVTFISDAYPNIKYKVDYLINKHHYKGNIYNLFAGRNNTNFWSSNKVLISGKWFLMSFLCLFRILKYRPQTVYLPYPGWALAVLLSILPKNFRPNIFIDSFISVYDTIVVDRKLVHHSNYIARILFYLERLAYSNCKTIITDTRESSLYLSKLFNVPIEKFRDCILTQAPIKFAHNIYENEDILRCLFVGTFIPLQGVEIIAETICKLKHSDNIHITMIGNGQTAPLVEKLLTYADKRNYIWEREWVPTKGIEEKIHKADLCLGIFGNTEKTMRVWPFKNYLYLSAGCPVVTIQTPCAETIKRKGGNAPIYFPESGTAESLLRLLKKLSKEKKNLSKERKNALEFYQKHLSNPIALMELRDILNESDIS